MNQQDVHCLNRLLLRRTKRGNNALTPSEKDRLIDLLLKQSAVSSPLQPAPPADDGLEEFGPEGGSVPASDRIARQT